MNAHASLPYVEVEASLAQVLAALDGHDEMPLSIRYDDRKIQAGYHITEVKFASLQTLDCGGNPDSWQETILQIDDIPAEEGKAQMTAGKFRSILATVDKKVRLNQDARLTIEIGKPGEAMRVFDVAGTSIEGEVAWLTLGVRAAICKPRHRAAKTAASTCCAPAKSSSCC